ncbi:MAG: hypothetical protein JWP46_365 [Modestobacter sp.]|nr:hypothetical protein [Modestobacter sp.]
MTATTPCYRHPRGVWIAACTDCTAWYLTAALARRVEVGAGATTARPAARPDVTDAPPAVLRLAA